MVTVTHVLIQLGRTEGAAGGGGAADDEAGGAGATLEATWAGGAGGALLVVTWAGGGAGELVVGGATHFVQIVEVEVRTTVEIEVVTC